MVHLGLQEIEAQYLTSLIQLHAKNQKKIVDKYRRIIDIRKIFKPSHGTFWAIILAILVRFSKGKRLLKDLESPLFIGTLRAKNKAVLPMIEGPKC